MITGHGGNIYELARQNNCRPDEILDMSSNLNPLGPPPGLLPYLQEHISVIKRLPDAGAAGLIKKFEARHGISPGRVLAGHGTTEFIYSLTRSLGIKNALILGPTYADYRDSCRQNKTRFDFLMAEDSTGFSHDTEQIAAAAKNRDMVFICNPNNPTGAVIPGQLIRELCASRPDTLFVVDESYLPFLPEESDISMIRSDLDNLIVLTSLSKIFSIPGLRTGFLKASPAVTDQCRNTQVPWNVNSLAQTAVDYLLSHTEETGRFIQNTRDFLETETKDFLLRFQGITAFSFLSGRLPYILIKINNQLTAAAVCAFLAKDNILIRNCANFEGLSETYIRVALKDRSANQRLADRLIQLVTES